MSAGSVFSVVLTFAVVLAVMGVALKLLRKYTMGGTAKSGTIQMEVLQRLPLGQRQGIAVVRIGTRVLAVSMGDGGIHPVTELDPSELTSELTSDTERAVTPAAIAEKATVALEALRALPVLNKAATPSATPQRISYVAPMEDFQAVLNIAMNGAARS